MPGSPRRAGEGTQPRIPRVPRHAGRKGWFPPSDSWPLRLYGRVSSLARSAVVGSGLGFRGRVCDLGFMAFEACIMGLGAGFKGFSWAGGRLIVA